MIWGFRVLSEELEKILTKPDNEKVLDWFLSQPRLPKGVFLIDENEVLTFKPEEIK